MSACIRCGASVNSSDNICDSCRNRNITLEKMYEFYRCVCDTQQNWNNKRYILNQKTLVNSRTNTLMIILWIIYIILAIVCFPFLFLIYIDNLSLLGTLYLLTLLLMCSMHVASNKRLYNYKQARMYQLNQAELNENTYINNMYSKSNKYIPYTYCEPVIVNILIQLIESNRADSLKEAINLYENIKYTDSMLSLQKEMSENARISAVANVATAVNTYGVYRNTRR